MLRSPSLDLGYLAVVRKADGALIGRCGLMDMAVETATFEGRLAPGVVRARAGAGPGGEEWWRGIVVAECFSVASSDQRREVWTTLSHLIHDGSMTPPVYARYRIVELADAGFQVEWLIGSRWSRVHDATTLAEAREWLIARIVDADSCA